MAYPKLITMLLPSGLRGVMVAAFLAAFLSTISTHLNWGSSYLINDFYKRFFKKDASQKHYVLVSRLIPVGLALGAMLVAFQMRSIGQSFTLILNLTAGIGPVYLLRWFWWRINPWSEIAAMTASLPAILIRPYAIAFLGLPTGLLVELSFMVVACALIWIPATLIAKPAEKSTLESFYSKVNPPGLWGVFSKKNKTKKTGWGYSLLQWIVSTIALISSAIGPINMVFRDHSGWILCMIAILGWLLVLYLMTRQEKAKLSA
jgi:Na+/proline symporter